MTPFPHCPHCEGRRFTPGPRGGEAINVQCCGCGAVFNIVLPSQYRPGPVLLINELPHPIPEARFVDVGWIIEITGGE